MKNARFWTVVTFVLVLASPAGADRHNWDEILNSFVAAWNSGDAAEMATLWTTDGAAINVLDRDVSGREEVARAFAASHTGFKLTEMSLQQSGAGRAVVKLQGELRGLKTSDGAARPPFLQGFTAVLVWGPDLPGGHHPKGRYYIASIR